MPDPNATSERVNLLDSALALAAVGLPVFPLRSTDKRPAVKRGFKAASTDPGDIARMFADPAAGLIGIPTGPLSGFDVLDIDPRKNGLEWLAANKSRLPDTRQHHTRSAGLHFLMQHAPGLRNSASKIAPGVDIRADGGYVVWWPAAGFHTTGSGWAPWPDWLLIEAMRRQTRAAAAPAPEELAPPSAADLIALLRAMPNPESTTRDDYVSLNLAVQGCLRALDALDLADANEAEEIREAAADWCSRWHHANAADYETELARWENDWSLRTNDVSGWRHVLALADQVGGDTTPYRVAAVVAEFGAVREPESRNSAAAEDLQGAPSCLDSTGDPYWNSKLLVQNGKPLGNLANVLSALRNAPEWQRIFRFDTFSNKVTVHGTPPFPRAGLTPRVLQEADFGLTTEWMQVQGINASAAVCADAISVVAHDDEYSSLTDYLRSVRFDGVARIDSWLIDFLGVADTPLHRAFSAKFLISAVARAFEPGCQVDTMLILEGRQSLKKSTALRTLFGSSWFTDHIPDLHNKDASMQIQGVWGLEHAEMATLNRTDANRIKEFVSRRIDRFRPPYGKLTADFPRQCVFAATLNPGAQGYLKDETGARRFWPVCCGVTWGEHQQVDIAALADVRDRLWAEAVARYASREPWWLDEATLETAQAEVADTRYDQDPWSDEVERAIAGRPFIALPDIFAALRISVQDQSRSHQMRIAGILRAAGWQRKIQRLNGQVHRVYVPTRPQIGAPATSDSAAEFATADRSDIKAFVN